MNNTSRAGARARSSGLESEGEGLENEGESTRIPARHANELPREFVASGNVAESVREAKKAIEGPECEEFRLASEIENE